MAKIIVFVFIYVALFYYGTIVSVISIRKNNKEKSIMQQFLIENVIIDKTKFCVKPKNII